MPHPKQLVKGIDKSKNKKHENLQNAKNKADQRAVESNVSLLIQQSVLNAFARAFADLLDASALDTNLKPILQEVKGHLYNRDFNRAFSQQKYLDAYTARWSASRALGYLVIFNDVLHEIDLSAYQTWSKDTAETEPTSMPADLLPSRRKEITVACLGGGAGAELCALAGVLQSSISSLDESRIRACLFDVADWCRTLDTLYTSLRETDASFSIRSPGRNFNPLITGELLKYDFQCLNLLEPTEQQRSTMSTKLRESHLVTIMFTLNELYSASLAKTQAMLFDLTAQVRPGTLLLVVDSASSYATVSVNKKETKYPMQWLLEHTLLKLAPKAVITSIDDRQTEPEEGDRNKECPSPVWECTRSIDSSWFRVAGLDYPLELENMRYQLHLYRRV